MLIGWTLLSMTLIDKQVVWSVQTEEAFLLVNSPKSSLFKFYIHWIKAILSLSVGHRGQYSACQCTKIKQQIIE